MKKGNSKRVPQAPSIPMPELEGFLGQFRVHFHQDRSFQALQRYITGLLTEHPNKNCDTIGSIVPGSNEQQLNNMLTGMIWDQEDLNGQRVKIMMGLNTEGDGALILDDTGFAKQGNCSVGVSRQYSGTLGKVGNCQVTVNCHYAERTIAWPVATRLYLPNQWAQDRMRRKAAGVPEEIEFKTKAEIALELLDWANQQGVKHRCVVADADYGDSPQFLNSLEQRRERYCVAVRANFSVALGRAAKVQRIDEVLNELPAGLWRTICWREGSQASLRAKFVGIRCWRVDGDGTRHVGWLIGQRPGRGQKGDWKYYWSNFGLQTSVEVMVEYAHRRYWVEQYHEEAKGELGWDQYQGRLWNGFERNAVSVMLAYSFLVWLEWNMRERERSKGKPRQPFSPSTRSQAAIPSISS